jgi:4a-hydroxytetrahydrobiopterin dehydratase
MGTVSPGRGGRVQPRLDRRSTYLRRIEPLAMLAQDLEQAYLKGDLRLPPEGRRPLAFLGGASSNLGIPTSSLRKKDGRDRYRERYSDPTRSRLRRADSRGDKEMETLTQMKCVACRKDAPTATDAEVAEFHRQVSDWEIVELDGIKRLRRVFSVADFAQALEFTKKVGELAAEESHHSALLTEWGRTTVTWWTHKIRGLHRNDFIMAAKTDELYQR